MGTRSTTNYFTR